MSVKDRCISYLLFHSLTSWFLVTHSWIFPKKNIDIFCSELEVTGSEDANVYFYDLARPKNSCVNKLQVCDILTMLATS